MGIKYTTERRGTPPLHRQPTYSVQSFRWVCLRACYSHDDQQIAGGLSPCLPPRLATHPRLRGTISTLKPWPTGHTLLPWEHLPNTTMEAKKATLPSAHTRGQTVLLRIRVPVLLCSCSCSLHSRARGGSLHPIRRHQAMSRRWAPVSTQYVHTYLGIHC